jgi:hypothetical protein
VVVCVWCDVFRRFVVVDHLIGLPALFNSFYSPFLSSSFSAQNLQLPAPSLSALADSHA